MSTLSSFTRAERFDRKLRMAIYGPSGSGKTYTSLMVANYIASQTGKRFAVIDTEHGSSALYGGGNPFDFDVAQLTAPFTPDKYADLMLEVASASDTYCALVIDSGSHAWSGEGGLIEMKDNIAQRRNSDSFRAWSEVTPIFNRFVETVISLPLHVIFTMRSRVQYSMETGDNNKTVVRKIGTGYYQREGLDYEFDMTILMGQDNTAEVDKTRFFPFAGQVFKKPGEDFIAPIWDWIQGDTAEDPYTYGDGSTVPVNAASRRVFSEYVAAHEGAVPDNSDALRAWNSART